MLRDGLNEVITVQRYRNSNNQRVYLREELQRVGQDLEPRRLFSVVAIVLGKSRPAKQTIVNTWEQGPFIECYCSRPAGPLRTDSRSNSDAFCFASFLDRAERRRRAGWRAGRGPR